MDIDLQILTCFLLQIYFLFLSFNHQILHGGKNSLLFFSLDLECLETATRFSKIKFFFYY